MTPTDRVERALDECEFDLLVASSLKNVYYTSRTYSVATKGLGETSFCLWSADSGGHTL